ncbi:preprotein translocase subunit SecE [Candidatus Wolfebacteria bacterium]|nr:preprotein translocase subunit SecE [Candidatus Wolfebacteria bacterium]
MLLRLKSYLQESRQEFRRVNWPTRQETIRLTLIVIGISLGVAVFLGILDFVFGYALEKFLA